MAPYFQRPENAISKAEEFINVGKPTRALDTLYDVIKSRKRNNTYSEKLIEQIMFKYLELCVDLKKSHVAKEGLYQYRNLSQTTNLASLASVVQGYLNMAEKRTDSARQESQDSVQEVDDLENLATPEMIMLSAVSVEDAQDRSDRTILMPWVKFLWESYCQCLELLRTNIRVERLYHDIAQQAFRFCLKYQRKTEFRKLCDKLRNHVDLILKQTPSPLTINLSHPDTQQMNLDTRLVQLDAAIQMELWQEAYKAVEDIHGLMTLSKKVFQPKMMANYYQKLALVFWKSGNLLFHAAAIFKHFQLAREMKKNISTDELAKMASRVLIAILAVSIPSQHPEFESFIETDRTPQEKMARLAVLLSLQQPPTRQSLLKDASRFGVVQAATPQIRDLYQWLEVDFHPLRLCQRIETSIQFVEGCDDKANLLQYVPALKDVTLVRLLKQVSQVYQSICFQRLLELAPITDAFSMERVIVDCVRHNDMQIRIDHRTRTVHFGTELAEAQSYSLAEGPHLQDMPSEQIRTQLMNMFQVLNRGLRTIHPDKAKIENNLVRGKIVEAYHSSKQRDHQKILNRQKIIEALKEDLEKINIERDHLQQQKLEKQKMEQQKQEEERLRVEREELQQRKEQEMLRQIKQNHLTEKLQQIKQTDIGKKILQQMDEKEIAELDTDQILAKQVEELEKEKRELATRLKNQEKKVDHLERAKRLEEITLLKQTIDNDKEQDKVYWQSQDKERIEKEIKEREEAVLAKKRMIRMVKDKEAYHNDLLEKRKAAFESRLAEFDTKLEKEKTKRLAERKRQRKDDRQQEWIRNKEEERQLKRDEEIKRKREEEAQILAEKRAKEEEEYMKRKEALDAIAEKTRQKEQEMEAKLKATREEARPAERRQRTDDVSSWRSEGNRDETEPPRRERRDDDRSRGQDGPNRPWRPAVAGAQTWREREKTNDDQWTARRENEGRDRDRGDRDRGDRDRGDRDRGDRDRGDRDRGDRDRGDRDRGDRDRGDRDRGDRDRGDRDRGDRDRGDRDRGDRDRGDRDRGDRGDRDRGDRGDRDRGDRGDRDRVMGDGRSNEVDNWRSMKLEEAPANERRPVVPRSFPRGERDIPSQVDRREQPPRGNFGERSFPARGERDFGRSEGPPRSNPRPRDDPPRQGGTTTRDDGGSWRQRPSPAEAKPDNRGANPLPPPVRRVEDRPRGGGGGEDDGWTTVAKR